VTPDGKPDLDDGLVPGHEVHANERLRVWGFPFAAYRILDTPLTVRAEPFRAWNANGGRSTEAIQIREGSPSLDEPMINLDGFFEPGHSGAPLLNEQNQVGGIGGGGIREIGLGLASPIWTLSLEDISLPPNHIRAEKLEKMPLPSFLSAVAGPDHEDEARKVLRTLGIESPRREDFLKAAQNGDEKELHLFLALDWEVDQATKGDRTALFLAVENGRTEVIPTLLAAGANRRFIASDGRSVLRAAMEIRDPMRRTQTLNALLGLGGGPHDTQYDPQLASDALALAVAGNNDVATRYIGTRKPDLLSNTDDGGRGDTLLHVAARTNSERSLQVLLELGNRQVDNAAGQRPIDVAIEALASRTFSRLARLIPVDELAGCRILLPLMDASKTSELYMVISLMPPNVKGCAGDTPLFMALRSGSTDVIKTVIDRFGFEDRGSDPLGLERDFAFLRNPHNGQRPDAFSIWNERMPNSNLTVSKALSLTDLYNIKQLTSLLEKSFASDAALTRTRGLYIYPDDWSISKVVELALRGNRRDIWTEILKSPTLHFAQCDDTEIYRAYPSSLQAILDVMMTDSNDDNKIRDMLDVLLDSWPNFAEHTCSGTLLAKAVRRPQLLAWLLQKYTWEGSAAVEEALAIAVTDGKEDVVELLLARQPNVCRRIVNYPHSHLLTKSNVTVFHLALVARRPDTLRRLIRELKLSPQFRECVSAISNELLDLKSDEFSFVFLRRLCFGDGRRPIAL
jgi:ankyrin repeat protein